MSNLFITGKENPIKIHLIEHIKDANNLELALENFSMYFSVPNIDKHNNTFAFRFSENDRWIKIYIPTGAFEIIELIQSINTIFKFRVEERVKYDTDESGMIHAEIDNVRTSASFPLSEKIFQITPNLSLMKSFIEIYEPGFEIDFGCEDSVGQVFGFDTIVKCGKSESKNLINVQDLTTILIHCDIVEGGRYNGKPSQCIYQFAPAESYGHLLKERPHNPSYFKIIFSEISQIEIKLTDQNGKLLNTRSETASITLKLRPIKF